MKTLNNILEKYNPIDNMEQQEVASLKQAIEAHGEKLFFRECLPFHLTSSIWAINPSKTKVLMAYHNLYKSFGWFGGHADGDRDPLFTARKEFEEECGIKNFKVLNNNAPIDFNICPVDKHFKKNKHVPSHLHYNFVYLFETDENEATKIADGENSAIKWVNIEDVMSVVNEEAMKPVYQRIIDKVKFFKYPA